MLEQTESGYQVRVAAGTFALTEKEALDLQKALEARLPNQLEMQKDYLARVQSAQTTQTHEHVGQRLGIPMAHDQVYITPMPLTVIR